MAFLNRIRRRAPRTPWSYRPGKGPIHRLPGRIKLLLPLLVSVSLFFGVPAMAGLTILLLLGALSAGIKPWELLAGSRPLVIMLLCILLFRSLSVSDTPMADIRKSKLALPKTEVSGKALRINLPSFSFNRPGFFTGLRFGWAILLSFAAGSLFFSVTTTAELKGSLGRTSRLGLGITLMLCFLPRFFELWEASNLACEARAGKRGLRRLIIILPLVCGRIIQNAAETAIALEARGLELYGERRQNRAKVRPAFPLNLKLLSQKLQFWKASGIFKL